jgi:ankyrin repeat protein
MNNDWFEKEQLHFAAQDGDLIKLKELVEKGFSINEFDELDKTPLHYAAEKELFEIVSFLIDSGADVNSRNEKNAGNTPLRQIAERCSYEMAALLIKAGADPTIPGWMQITALGKARNRKSDEGKRVYTLLKQASDKKQMI